MHCAHERVGIMDQLIEGFSMSERVDERTPGLLATAHHHGGCSPIFSTLLGIGPDTAIVPTGIEEDIFDCDRVAVTIEEEISGG